MIAEKTYADDLHLVSHQTGLHAVLRLDPAGSDATVVATPTLLTWRDGTGRDRGPATPGRTPCGCGAGARAADRRGGGHLTPFSGTYLYLDPLDGCTCSPRTRPAAATGSPWSPARSRQTAGAEAARHRRPVSRPPRRPAVGGGDRGVRDWPPAVRRARRLRPAVAATQRRVRRLRRRGRAVARRGHPGRRPGRVRQLWSATVAPAGFVTRPAVLMSKHWMDKVWSWDHCFNAIALAAGEPELAWHQFQLPFDHQDAAGRLPDSVTHSEVLHNYVKPPIHGWALRHLRRRLFVAGQGAPAQTHELAGPLDRVLAGRPGPGQDLPHYQHGNDSGWDNATTFDGGRVLQTADLAAFLVTQLRCLADLATELGEPAGRWSAEADRIRAAMLRDGGTARASPPATRDTGRRRASRSLLDLMPVTLGADPARPVTAALARGVEAHLTTHGLATEPPDSADYLADGYWRGPIWAPSTVLVEDGLRRAGHTGARRRDRPALPRPVREVRLRGELPDAETGAGLGDRAYSPGPPAATSDPRRRASRSGPGPPAG